MAQDTAPPASEGSPSQSCCTTLRYQLSGMLYIPWNIYNASDPRNPEHVPEILLEVSPSTTPDVKFIIMRVWSVPIWHARKRGKALDSMEKGVSLYST